MTAPQAPLRRAPHIAFPHERLCCPHGHKLDRDSWPAGDSPMITQRCNFKEPPGHTGVCGSCVYWLLLPGDFKLLVEVSSREAHEMEKRRMTLEQILEFLGLRWPQTAAA